MATSKAFLEFVLEQLSELDGVTHRMMMGEYIIYYRKKIAAYVCDDRFFVKPVPSAIALMPNARFEPPYDGAKNMLLVDDIDNREFLTNLFEAMYDELPSLKKKR